MTYEHTRITIQRTERNDSRYASRLRDFALTVAEEVKASWSAKDRQDKRLTAKEAAAQLGVTVNSLYRWNKNGYLSPAGHIGQKPYYLQSQIDGIR